MLQPEQWGDPLKKYLVPKFSKPGDLFLDAHSRWLSTSKACHLLDKHRWFPGCETAVVATSMVVLVEVYGCQLQNDKSDFKGGEN